MIQNQLLSINILILIAMACVYTTSDIDAKSYTYKKVRASNPWARATSKLAKTGVVYITSIHNTGERAVKIIGFSTNIANKVQLHKTVMENNITKMQYIKSLKIGPGKSIHIKPGGLHIMLMGLKRPLKENNQFPLIIKFETLGNLETMVNVKNFSWRQKKPLKHKHMHH